MKKRKKKNYDKLFITIVVILFLISMHFLINSIIERSKYYTFNYENELLKSKKCYEKEEQLYCEYEGKELAVNYYYKEGR